jgi:hypothetical protein
MYICKWLVYAIGNEGSLALQGCLTTTYGFLAIMYFVCVVMIPSLIKIICRYCCYYLSWYQSHSNTLEPKKMETEERRPSLLENAKMKELCCNKKDQNLRRLF